MARREHPARAGLVAAAEHRSRRRPRRARERAVHSDWAHDHDPYAWAEYRRLEALAELAPLPERDALDDLPDGRDEPDRDSVPGLARR